MTKPNEPPSLADLTRLKVAWGGGSVADIGYMAQVCERALVAEDSVLECGSGLTTLLLGIYADVPVWSLEESERWGKRMRAALRYYGITNVNVVDAPLRDHGGYIWYCVPSNLPERFSLVVCDGPITRQGADMPRYGLVPTMRERFDGNTVILLDDAARTAELRTMERWRAEGFSTSIVVEEGRAFAIVKASPQTINNPKSPGARD